MKYLKIPMDRIGVLIGHKGETKKDLEERTGLKINIDSNAGEIVIDDHETDDPLLVIKIENIVKAIGRGFSPEKVRRLLDDEEAMLMVIDLRDFVGKSESDIKRLSGRIIGKEGKTRRLIEELTDTYVSVYGHTISIIGAIEEVEIARQAIEMFIRGRLHTSVYRFLHAKRRKLKKRKMELWKKPYEKARSFGRVC